VGGAVWTVKIQKRSFSNMRNLFELKKQRAFALNKAEIITSAAATERREFTDSERQEWETAMSAVEALHPQIAKIERNNTIFQHVANGKIIPGGGSLKQAYTPGAPVVLSDDYYNDFFTWIGTRGQQMGAALYEGTGSAGGFTVPVIVDGQVVPLAPLETGVRTVATVVPTSSDIKIPVGTSFGTVAAKLESGATDNFFTETDPVIAQFTLSAFMAGGIRTLSWELAQDVPSFQQFAITDLITAQQVFEENLFVNGTGTGQAQGLIGNTGAGVTGVAAGTDVYASELLDATFGVLGTLNAVYHPGASWLMNRATGVVIRKAQKTANLFQPVWTRENGKDFLHGYPVTFSGSMPSVATTKTPILFGDFKSGYVIGDRGGSGINVKILDQPKASEGQLQLLAYRRTAGRVRRSEAIQAITLA
jgi:HK97 family phage major capsid protein